MKKIKVGLNNLYLFENSDNEYLLLDTGVGMNSDKIIKLLNDEIGNYNKIKVIVITHTHEDHIGNLEKLKVLTNSKIICHENAKIRLLNNKRILPNGFYKVSKIISNILKSSKVRDNKNKDMKEIKDIVFINFKNIGESITLNEFGFEEINLIYTPGHSKDSISLETNVNNENICCCGDVVQNIFLKEPLIPLFGEDRDELFQSWKYIIFKNYRAIYPAIGKEITIEDMRRKMVKYEKNKI